MKAGAKAEVKVLSHYDCGNRGEISIPVHVVLPLPGDAAQHRRIADMMDVITHSVIKYAEEENWLFDPHDEFG